MTSCRVPALVAFLVAAAFAAPAQGRPGNRRVVEGDRVTLSGNVPPRARPENDAGRIADDQPLRRLLLVLQRTPTQQRALERLLADQQDPASPDYRRWLTPREFGARFGPGDAEVAAVTDWLRGHGMSVKRVATGRAVIELDASAGQVTRAFGTELHRFVVDGVPHVANVADPSIPRALSSTVAGLVSLHDFRKRSNVKPLFEIPRGKGAHGVGPGDFHAIYDVPAALDGHTAILAVIGQSNIDLADVRNFRSLFGLPANDPHIILDGPDPGKNGDEVEADLDVQWAGAVATGVQLDLVLAAGTETTDGIDLSALYVIDHDLADVVSLSYGACEQEIGLTAIAYYSRLWEQAAAQGMTVAISSGDSGSGCVHAQGLGVNGLASSPYVVVVGGTDFDDLTTASMYWSTSNDTVTQTSALGYVPERAWGNSKCVAQLPAACTAPGDGDYEAGGGGPSNVVPKPPWQKALTPDDNVRDMPDVSLFAGNGANLSFFIICKADSNDKDAPCDLQSPYQNFLAVGGTSGSTPAFAGIVALLVQQLGHRVGNANPTLYDLAAHPSATHPAFHDVTAGSIDIACSAGSFQCSNAGRSGFGVLLGGDGMPAFAAKTGYDYATGLGSLDAKNLIDAWPTAVAPASTTTLTAGASPVAHGAAATFKVVVAGGGGTPTGAVVLVIANAGGTHRLGPFELSGGSVDVSTKLLPGGALQISAHYGGDTAHAPSTSSPLAFTVMSEASNLQAQLVTSDFDTGDVAFNRTSTHYGLPYVLRVDVANAAGALCAPLEAPIDQAALSGPCAGGSMTLTSDGAPLDAGTFTVNERGYVEDAAIQLDAGDHTIAASYTGDGGFNASTVSFQVSIATAGTGTVVAARATGTGVDLIATVSSTSNGAPPTGTVQFFDGTAPVAATVTYMGTDGPACSHDDATKCATLVATAFVTNDKLAAVPPPGDLLRALAVLALLAGAARWLPLRTRLVRVAFTVALALGCGGDSGPRTVMVSATYSGDKNYVGSTASAASVDIR